MQAVGIRGDAYLMLSAMEFLTLIVISFDFTYLILSSLFRYITENVCFGWELDDAWLINRPCCDP